MHSRGWLDDYLSRALNVPLNESGRLKIVDDSSYVLTLDYTLKLLNIHERHECGMPVIIEGETGVGKTALIEVLSKLWNSAHLNIWHKARDTILDFMERKMSGEYLHTRTYTLIQYCTINTVLYCTINTVLY